MTALERNPGWWRSIEAADPQRQPDRPSMIVPGHQVLEPFDSLDLLAARIAGLLGRRAAVLTRTVATFEGYDTFPAFSVHARAEGAGDQAPAALWVCCVAVQKTRAEDLEAAIAAAQAGQPS